MNTRPGLMLRMPPDIKAWLAARAEKNSRSQNGEILHLLKQVMAAEQTKEEKVQ
jgi:hypothetical protein